MAGTYWLTILPDTSKLKPAIEAAMRGEKITADFGVDKTKAKKAGKEAADTAKQEADKNKPKVSPEADKPASRKAGEEAAEEAAKPIRNKRPKVKPDPDVPGSRKAGEESGAAAAGGIGASLKKLAPMLGGLTILTGLKSSLTEGMNFTETLNVMKGVTGATGDQMAQASALAKQLGTDVSLAGVNANDAAAAMTELAKGGMSVEESMGAVRGSLALAGAAGIGAAEAATIQSDALHTFKLGAEDASRVADLLTNAANASSSEVPQMAQALAQAGSAAAGFKIPIEDTLTSLAMFSNFGIKGSDAGTLMKTSLLAITDGGKPATEAMSALGLQLYDTEGRFKGYPEMLRQVAEASGRMTEEQFQAATAVLFGSDAMRGAMIAANGGAEAFGKTADQVRNGAGAAQMAAARMEGLPGAWANFQNTLDGVKMSVYDMVKGPLEGLVNALSGIPGFITRNADAFKIIGGVIATVAVPALTMWIAAQAKALAVSAAKGVTDLVGAWGKLGGKILDAVANIVYYTMQQGRAIAGNVAGALSNIAGAFGKVGAAAKAAGAAMLANPVGLVIAGLVAIGVALWAFFTKTETGRKMWAALWGGIKTAAAAVWDWMKGALATLGSVLSGIWNFIAPAVTAFGRFGAAVANLSFEAFMAGIRLVGNVIEWLWNTVAVPAFNGIKSAVEVMWAGAQIIWEAFKQAVQWVGDKISWLWQTIAVPAFDAIKGAISTMWDAAKPIWDWMLAAFDNVAKGVGKVKDIFVSAFNTIKDTVKSVWDSIGGIFDTMANGIGKVADWFGGVGRSSGGPIPGNAQGGRISGPGSGTSDSILARLSNGEYVINAASTGKYLPLIEAINRDALPGFAAGGLTPHATEMKSVISRMFGVSNIGGYREPDGYNEHSTGNALDVMIPNSDTEQGKALGNSIAAWALKNAKAIGLTGMIWRQTSYGYGKGFDGAGTPMQDRGSPTANHFDHVHIFMNDKPDTSLSLSGAPSLVGASTSAGAGSGSGSYRAATSSELSASSNRVSAANKAVTQAQQRVDDRTFTRDQAQKRLDKARAEGKDIADEEESLRRAERELVDATDNLTEKRDKAAEVQQADTDLRTTGKLVEDKASTVSDTTSGGGKSGPNTGDLGQMFVSGVLESFGLDGALFSNPLEWPSVKSLMAGINYAGGLLSIAGAKPEDQAASGGGTVGGFAGGAADAVGLGGLLSAIPSATQNALPNGTSGSPALAAGEFNPAVAGGTAVAVTPGMSTFAPAPHPGGGQKPGPAVDNSININGNVGMDPAALQTKIRAEQNARTRTTVMR